MKKIIRTFDVSAALALIVLFVGGIEGVRGVRDVEKAIMEDMKPKVKIRGTGGLGELADQSDWDRTYDVAISDFLAFKANGDKGKAGPLTDKCHQTVTIDNLTQATQSCPTECPFMAEVPKTGKATKLIRRNLDEAEKGCKFQCIQKNECGTGIYDKDATVPDPHSSMCRRCAIPGCLKCTHEHGDRCVEDQCGNGYYWGHHTCYPDGTWIFYIIYAIVGVLLVFILAWYIDLLCLRPATNKDGLEQGIRFRNRTKLHMPKTEGDDTRRFWPLMTNFQRKSNSIVAGPGTVLHFNFLLALIVWPALVGAAWYAVARSTSMSLLHVGMLDASTSAQLCGVITWGYWTQFQFMDLQVKFIGATYVSSFLMCIIFAVKQLRRYREMDQETTHKDFVAYVKGLSIVRSSPTVEEDTKAFLEKATGQKLIGVSLCWNFVEKIDEIAQASEADAKVSSKNRSSGILEAPIDQAPPEQTNCFRKVFVGFEDVLFYGLAKLGELVYGNDAASAIKKPDIDIVPILENLETSGYAFAVFETEEGRDAAVETSDSNGGFSQQSGQLCTLNLLDSEPEGVLWANFGYSRSRFVWRFGAGIFAVILTLVAWAFAFYLPYAYYISAFSYAHGETPSFASGMVFTLLVVLGNQAVYFISATVSERVGYHLSDNKEAMYLVLYTIAQLINVFVDMIITGWLSYMMMVGAGVHLAGGVLLSEVERLHDILESMPMQKSLGYQLWLYNFPSTFLIPYICEPIFAIIIPWHLMYLMVRSHKEVVGREAELSMAIFTPMDLGRYSDFIVNLSLAVLVFFCPSGRYARMFVALFASHIFIYYYDQYRILRCVPGFCYSSDWNDRIAHLLLSLPCGLILLALIFKSNCLGDFDGRWADDEAETMYCVRGETLAYRMLAGFLIHVVVHCILVWKVPPCCGKFIERVYHEKTNEKYPDVAGRLPCSWFNSNPVHNLRSKHIHKHSPPSTLFIRGKEHILLANPSIACYFEDKACAAE